DVVAILAHAGLTLRRQHPDDVERLLLDAHHLAHGIAVGPEELVADHAANHRNLGGRRNVLRREERALRDLPRLDERQIDIGALPSATIVMTAATPMIMPSIVSAVRILFRPSAFNAIRKIIRIDMIYTASRKTEALRHIRS